MPLLHDQVSPNPLYVSGALKVAKSTTEFVLPILDVTQIQGGETVGGARGLLLTAPDELLEKQPGNGDSRG